MEGHHDQIQDAIDSVALDERALFSSCLTLSDYRQTRNLRDSSEPETAEPSPPRFVTGEVFADLYVVEGLLGSGAMADVFSAFDRELRRKVAIKVSKRDVEADYLRAEGQLLGGIRHPGVVTVHNMGSHQDNLFLVLERLFGATLAEHIKRRSSTPFPLEHGLRILIQLCEALDTLHNAGIIHRDIKPDNIMIVPGGRAVLFDFGVALSRGNRLTKNAVVGTPGYMAPELTSANARPGTVAQDIYALGCLAFELFTGRLPYNRASSVSEMLAAHAELPTPKLSEFAEVPPLLEQVVLNMLEKDPENRVSTVGSVLAWLRGIERGPSGRSKIDTPVSVLIVDDDEDIRALLSSIIERRLPGISVRTARDGEEGITQFSIEPPDVLLFDLDMPNVSGVELAMHLAGMPESRNTLLCTISSHTNEEERRLLKQLGIRDFIAKSSPPSEILERVEYWVTEAANRRRLAS